MTARDPLPDWYDAERAADLAVILLTRNPEAEVLRVEPLAGGASRIDGRTGNGVDGFASWSVVVWGTHSDAAFGPPPRPPAAADPAVGPTLAFHTLTDEALVSFGGAFSPATEAALERIRSGPASPAPSNAPARV